MTPRPAGCIHRDHQGDLGRDLSPGERACSRPARASPDALLNLSLQNAALASGGKISSLLGGVPVVVDGQVIGAVGIAGGAGEQDAQIANAGVAALLEQLRNVAPADKWTAEKPK